jgi:hypothetical protein
VRGIGPWIVLALLGASHGLNPGMGWLFAVSLGYQEGSRKGVLRALGPIALGHELSVGAVVVLVLVLQAAVPTAAVRSAGAIVLVAFGCWKLARPNRHPRWVGMRVNSRQLTAWSFLMSSAHGAGLMLMPVIAGAGAVTVARGAAGQGVHALESGVGTGVATSALAVGIHTLAMLAVMGIVAVLVYEKVGLGILRSAWVNVDMLWAGALVAAGLFALFT